MAKEKVLEFSCPMKIRLVLPNDCIMDEDALRKRLEAVGPQLFMGLCDACPRFQEQKKD